MPVVAALVVIALFVVTVGRTAAERRGRLLPRPEAPTLVPIGPMAPRGQAAIVRSGVAVAGDRVTVDGEDWTISEVETFGEDMRAWLAPGPTQDRRHLLDAEVATLAAALQVELEDVATATIAAMRVPYDDTVPALATLKVREALHRTADLCPPWLVNAGVTSSADLPHDALPTCDHVGGGVIRCNAAWMAHRIAERRFYG